MASQTILKRQKKRRVEKKGPEWRRQSTLFSFILVINVIQNYVFPEDIKTLARNNVLCSKKSASKPIIASIDNYFTENNSVSFKRIAILPYEVRN